MSTTVKEEVSATATATATAEEVSPTATDMDATVVVEQEEKKVKRKFTLKSSDGESFEVDEDVAGLSQTIKHMIEDGCADDGIPLPNVTGEILSKVLDYCKQHVAAPKGEGEGDRAKAKELRNWDIDFVKVDNATLFELILAANYLDIKSLLDLVSQTVADHIKDKTVEEVREIFNIKNDFTPEEEAEVRKENQWAFE